MCNPLAIGAAVVTGAGTLMQMQSQRSAEKKMNSAIRRNSEANEKLQQDSRNKTLMAAEEGFNRDNFDQTAENQTQVTKQQFLDAQGGGLPGDYMGVSADDNTRRYQEKKSADASDYTARVADALARMRGFENSMRIGGTGISRASEGVSLNNNFQQGNNAILPIQLQAAQNSAKNPFADLMVGLGSAGLTAGLSAPAQPAVGSTVTKATPFGNMNLTSAQNFRLV